jgi:hypothetical protein
LTAIQKRSQRNRQGYERREKGKKKKRGRDMAGGEGADGVVEGVGKVGRVTGEVEVEVTGTRCYNNNSALHLRASASLGKYFPEKSQQKYKYKKG